MGPHRSSRGAPRAPPSPISRGSSRMHMRHALCTACDVEVVGMRPIRYSIVGFALAGCMGSFGSAPNDRFQQPGEGDHAVVPACPVDPDCGFTGTCDQYVCPDYWLCEDLS